MTYSNVISRLKFRILGLENRGTVWRDDALFSIVNDVVRTITDKVRDTEKTATLSIVAGTDSYTLSTVITDLSEINFIVIGTDEIVPKTIYQFNSEKAKAEVNSQPEFFKVFAGILTLYPKPSENKSATVYYQPLEPILSYSSVNMSGVISLANRYFDTVLYTSAAVCFEVVGLEERASYYHALAQIKLEETATNKPKHDLGSEIKYQSIV